MSFHLPHLLGLPNGTLNEIVATHAGVDSTDTAASKVSEAQRSTATSISDFVLDTSVSTELPSTPTVEATTDKEETAANTLSMAVDSINCDVGSDHVASQSMDCAAEAKKVISKDCGTVDTR